VDMADVDARVDRASSPPGSLLNSSIHYAASLAPRISLGSDCNGAYRSTGGPFRRR
jgi:hypothetical protein